MVRAKHSFWTTPLVSHRSIVNQDRSGPSVPHINGFKGSDAEAQQIAYRSINRGSIDKISSQLSRNKHDWKDAKAVMG